MSLWMLDAVAKKCTGSQALRRSNINSDSLYCTHIMNIHFLCSKQGVLQWPQCEQLNGHTRAHDIMIIPRNPGYCHGGMRAFQGHVRTDTKPEQINRTVSFSPTAGTERKKGGKKEKWSERRKKEVTEV